MQNNETILNEPCFVPNEVLAEIIKDTIASTRNNLASTSSKLIYKYSTTPSFIQRVIFDRRYLNKAREDLGGLFCAFSFSALRKNWRND